MQPRLRLRKGTYAKSLQQIQIVYCCRDAKQFVIDAGVDGIYEHQWDKENQRIIEHENADRLNMLLIKNFGRVTAIVNDYKWENQSEKPSIEYLKTQYFTVASDKPKLDKKDRKELLAMDVTYAYGIFLREKEKTNLAPQLYKIVGDNLKEFVNGKTVSLIEIDREFLKNFLNFYLKKKNLVSKGRLGNRTIDKRLKNFCTFLRNMEIEEELQVNPAYKKFESGLPILDHQIIIPTYAEFQKLIDAEKYITLSKKFEYVRDLFVVQSCLGLRYSEVIRIRNHMIKTLETPDLSGKSEENKYLEIDVVKRDEIVFLRIPISDICDRFLSKYGYDLHDISNQKYDQYLEDLFKDLEFNEIISTKERWGYDRPVYGKKFKYELMRSHTARRFFISWAVDHGIPDKAIMSWTGQKNIDVYHEYVKLGKLGSQKLYEGFKMFDIPEKKATKVEDSLKNKLKPLLKNELTNHQKMNRVG